MKDHWLEEIATAYDGRVSDGQGEGKCPVCDKRKFRFSIGEDGAVVLSCQSGECRLRSIDTYDHEWFRQVQNALADAGVPRVAFRRSGHRTANAEPSSTAQNGGPRLPDGETLAEQSHVLRVLIERGRFVEHWWLTPNVIDHADLGFDRGWDEGRGRLVCPVEDFESGRLHTVIYRSLSGVQPKSRVAKGTRDRHLYAPFGIDRAQPVLLVGGEKDVLAGFAAGLWSDFNLACFTNGDGPPRDVERAGLLRGLTVVVAGDLDAADKSRDLATWLLDVAADVRVADLSAHADRLPASGDVCDLLGVDNLGADAMRTLIDAALPWGREDGAQHTYDVAVDEQALRIRQRRAAQRLVDAEEADRHAITLPRVTLESVLALDRPERPPQRVAQMHEVGHNTTVTAKFKTGKTTLASNLLRSLADDEDFLDRFPVSAPDGRVGLLNYEMAEHDMLDWLEEQGIRKVGRIAPLELRGRNFSLASERNQLELISWCRAMEVEVLHLDPHRRAFAGFGSENSNDDVNRFTDVLDLVKREAGVEDLFLYVHSGRAITEMGSEHARGATALDDWTDNRWVLTSNEDGDRFLYADGRTGNVPEFRLTFDRSGRRLRAEDGNRRQVAVHRHRAAVLNALEVVGEAGAKVGELEERLAVSKKGDLSPVLKSLVSEGLVVQKSEGPAKRNWLVEHAPEVRS